MTRKKQSWHSPEGPDMVDANAAVQSLWDDFQLHFRCTLVVRDKKLLLRAYAHNRECLSDSDRQYQSYKRFDLTGRPDLPNALYALAFDLYWQAQSDSVNFSGKAHEAGGMETVDLPPLP